MEEEEHGRNGGAILLFSFDEKRTFELQSTVVVILIIFIACNEPWSQATLKGIRRTNVKKMIPRLMWNKSVY